MFIERNIQSPKLSHTELRQLLNDYDHGNPLLPSLPSQLIDSLLSHYQSRRNAKRTFRHPKQVES